MYVNKRSVFGIRIRGVVRLTRTRVVMPVGNSFKDYMPAIQRPAATIESKASHHEPRFLYAVVAFFASVQE